jgi:FkbM family methyltransferase
MVNWVNSAVGKKPVTPLSFLSTSTGNSSFQEGCSVKEINVKAEALDQIVNTAFPDRKIAVLKIEAEGSEPEVLRGASQTLARTKIVAVDAREERKGE